MQKIDHQLLKEGRDGAGLELEEEGLARAQKEEQKATLLPRSRLLSPHGLFTSLLYPYANIHYYSGLNSINTYLKDTFAAELGTAQPQLVLRSG